jgi:hypothetical protein
MCSRCQEEKLDQIFIWILWIISSLIAAGFVLWFGPVGTASRVPRVTLALACSEGLYTLSHPVASSLIHIQHQPEYYTHLQLTVPLCYQQDQSRTR